MFVSHESAPSVLQCGVPQGTVLGPLLFTMYTHPLSTVICQSRLSYNFFANDSQLHKSSVPSDFIIFACLKDCIEDAAERMGDSKLKMNDDKAELMVISTRSKLNQVIPNLALCPSLVVIYHSLTHSVRNLGFYLDETLSKDANVRYLCRISFVPLRTIGKIRSFLSTDAANKLAVSLILSMLDYCNSLLIDINDNKLNKLQRMQNHAARLVLRKPRHASATALLRTLHWLPVRARI